MCGIVGGWFLNAGDQIDRRMEDALFVLRHRGPDDRGFERYSAAAGQVYFGHTRLSIIDLSQGGHQPMVSSDGRFTIVFNGEIYNYRELREELVAAGFSFGSDSDTEVLLVAWSRWGREVLPRLVGMFAFVIFDRRENSLTCVRDSFGIKPFFFSEQPGSFIFGSEVGAVTRLSGNVPTLDWQQAYDYLVTADYDSGERTFFENIRQLRPGHILHLNCSDQRQVIERWWQPRIAECWSGSFLDAAEHLREMFLSSVRFHLRSDVPLGAALSGGLDSSSVVCAMRYLEPDAEINTFSYIAAGSDVSEEAWVDRVTSKVAARAFKVRVTGEELARDLDDMILAQGEPFGSTSIYAQYRVFQLAHENGITVTLDGQGADELLGGYMGYPGARMHSLLDRRHFGEVIDFLQQWSGWPGRNWKSGIARLVNELTDGDVNRILRRLGGYRDFPNWLRADLLKDAGVQGGWNIQTGWPEKDSHGRRLMFALREALAVKGLPALLRHADRNSMRFSVESRVPFLTIEMTDFLLSLPEEYLVSGAGETKSVFRAAMRGIVPDDVLDRRDKIGFATPERDWLLGMADTARSWLVAGCDVPFVDWQNVVMNFDAVIQGKKPFDWQAWRWINFVRWHRLVFGK